MRAPEQAQEGSAELGKEGQAVGHEGEGEEPEAKRLAEADLAERLHRRGSRSCRRKARSLPK